MVTITVSLPSNNHDMLNLIETMTKEKGYKLVNIDRDNQVILFEINKNFGEGSEDLNKVQTLLD